MINRELHVQWGDALKEGGCNCCQASAYPRGERATYTDRVLLLSTRSSLVRFCPQCASELLNQLKETVGK